MSECQSRRDKRRTSELWSCLVAKDKEGPMEEKTGLPLAGRSGDSEERRGGHNADTKLLEKTGAVNAMKNSLLGQLVTNCKDRVKCRMEKEVETADLSIGRQRRSKEIEGCERRKKMKKKSGKHPTRSTDTSP